MEKKNETKEVYEAPVIETVEVRVEQGFQTSEFDSLGGDRPTDDPTR